MKSDEIEQIVGELLRLIQTQTNESIDKLPQFVEFKTKNRMFYETILKGEFDESIFKQMMKMKKKLEGGEDSYSVDVKFGRYMAEKFIDPVINKEG